MAVAAWIVAASVLGSDFPRERIVYTTRRPTGWQLYLVDPGSAPKQLTDTPALNYDPTFSPDGRWIVFCSERSGRPHLYALDLKHPDSPKPLTRGAFMDGAPAFSPDGKDLFFVSDREGNADIFRMPFRPDRSEPSDAAINLTRSPTGDFRPAPSPDGRLIAFSSDRDLGKSYPYHAEIYVMNRDGSAPRRLTTADARSGSPVWSRDGNSLFFYSDREGGTFRIWAMNSDGTLPRPITPGDLEAFSPAVLPDGRVCFAAKKGDGFQLFSVSANGTDLRPEGGSLDCRGPAADRVGRLVCTGRASSVALPFLDPGAHAEVSLPDRILDVQAVHALFCAFGPDGRELVTGRYLDGEDPENTRLVASRLDGSGERELFRAPKSASIWGLSWASKADLIAFTVGPMFAPDDAVVDIWTVRGDGSGARNLTGGRLRNNAFPDLTPDGRQIVFRSTRDGEKRIYLMGPDSSSARRITAGPGDNTMPSISPRGDLIAFSTFQILLQRLKNGQPDGSPRVFQEYSPSVHPRFSPDGKWIVFASRRAWLNDEGALSNGNAQPYGEIFVAPVEGNAEPIRLTHDRWEDSVPCWGPVPPAEK